MDMDMDMDMERSIQVEGVMMIPCAACKILRRRCSVKCVLAPYFPPTHPADFTSAHRVFGASNIIKFVQELAEGERADAVSSMVYEARARLRDPVYGCAGAISHLHNQVSHLQAQLAKAQAQLLNMHCQHQTLLAMINTPSPSPASTPTPTHNIEATNCFNIDPNNNHNLHEGLWEPLSLWT